MRLSEYNGIYCGRWSNSIQRIKKSELAHRLTSFCGAIFFSFETKIFFVKMQMLSNTFSLSPFASREATHFESHWKKTENVCERNGETFGALAVSYHTRKKGKSTKQVTRNKNSLSKIKYRLFIFNFIY